MAREERLKKPPTDQFSVHQRPHMLTELGASHVLPLANSRLSSKAMRRFILDSFNTVTKLI